MVGGGQVGGVECEVPVVCSCGACRMVVRVLAYRRCQSSSALVLHLHSLCLSTVPFVCLGSEARACWASAIISAQVVWRAFLGVFRCTPAL